MDDIQFSYINTPSTIRQLFLQLPAKNGAQRTSNVLKLYDLFKMTRLGLRYGYGYNCKAHNKPSTKHKLKPNLKLELEHQGCSSFIGSFS